VGKLGLLQLADVVNSLKGELAVARNAE